MPNTPLEFEPQKALKRIALLGYHHVDVTTPRELLEPFMEEHGLKLEEGAQCTVTLVPNGQKSQGTDWERIRKEKHEKAQKRAASKKKKELI